MLYSINIRESEAILDRNMTTGRHLIRDIYCEFCGECVGWKYVEAFEPDQKYKENKFILEKAYLQEVDNAAICDLPDSAFEKGGMTRLNYFHIVRNNKNA